MSPASAADRSFALRCIFGGALLMFLGVVLGAFGAHALQEILSPRQLSSFQTGVLYQQLHSLALILVGVIALFTAATGWLPRAAMLFGVGILFFSGSIYLMTLGAPRRLGIVTPVGGICLMLGWLALAAHAWRAMGRGAA